MKQRVVIGILVVVVIGLVAYIFSTNRAPATEQVTDSKEPVASALPPHMATIKGDAFDGDVPITMKVGEFYVFTGDSTGWVVDTQNPELVKVEQGGVKDTYETNPGFQAIADGRAVVTVTSPTNVILTVMVTIEK